GSGTGSSWVSCRSVSSCVPLGEICSLAVSASACPEAAVASSVIAPAAPSGRLDGDSTWGSTPHSSPPGDPHQVIRPDYPPPPPRHPPPPVLIPALPVP